MTLGAAFTVEAKKNMAYNPIFDIRMETRISTRKPYTDYEDISMTNRRTQWIRKHPTMRNPRISSS